MRVLPPVGEKKKIVLPVLAILTGIFVFTTANVQEQVLSMFIGSVAVWTLAFAGLRLVFKF